jgi:hypothetical protein
MDSRVKATTMDSDRSGGERFAHRGYGLVIAPAHQGWQARIEDPAGHAADVLLQEQLAVEGFPSAELAQAAAEHFVDELLGQESSY